MSQKEESKFESEKATEVQDKWRKFTEQQPNVDDEHLLSESDEPAVTIEEQKENKQEDKTGLLEKQIEQHKDQLVRAMAEVDNMRRRMEQEVSKARKFGVERLIAELIPVADSLIRGLEGHQSDHPEVQLMRKGMELTLDILNKILEKNGVTSIDPKIGDLFDPMQHEAMSMQQHPDSPSHTIIQVLQKGYALHGRVIRAAMVIVAG